MIRGVSHISLSVRDLDASLSFYRDVLGLTVLREPFRASSSPGVKRCSWRGRSRSGCRSIETTTAQSCRRFAPVDHLALHVSSIAGIDVWSVRLNSHGIDHSEIRPVASGSIIEFRDPDGFQLEIFARG